MSWSEGEPLVVVVAMTEEEEEEEEESETLTEAMLLDCVVTATEFEEGGDEPLLYCECECELGRSERVEGGGCFWGGVTGRKAERRDG